MKNKQSNSKKGGLKNRSVILRSLVIGTLFIVAAGYLALQLSTIQLEQTDEWRALASNQHMANQPLEPERGVIYDTNMKEMAVSATVWTVEAAPDVLAKSKLKEKGDKRDPARVASQQLAQILELDEEELYTKLADKKSRYCKIKGKIDKPLADEIRDMAKETGLSGIYLVPDSKRYYPYEELGAAVLGFTNDDGDGIEGLESWYNEALAGTPGRQVALRNAWGGEIADDEDDSLYPAEDGQSLVLTLDAEVQQILEKYLSEAVEEHSAHERGMGIVMDVNTGAILGIAVNPSYDPNKPYEIYNEATRAEIDAMPDGPEKVAAQSEARTLQWRNKALADTYEPGSVFKVLTTAAALDSGTYNQNAAFHCTSKIKVEDREFGCALGTAHGSISLRNALIESCNVSYVQMASGMGADVWHDYLNAFGMTEPTGIDLPGEPDAASINYLVYSLDQMGAVELASCSFGQSNKYTALQMITAMSAAVNGGNLMQPYMVRQVLDASGNVVEEIEPNMKRQVISPETSAILRDTLEELVAETANGHNAYVAGYHVGGKSGTSQKLELLPEKEVYLSSFLGFAPAYDPQIAVLIVLDEPEDPQYGNYFGGRLAGPTVGNVIRDSLQALGIEPYYDNPEDLARTTLNCPDVTGSTVSAAQNTLSQNGLHPLVVGGGDKVVAQYPEAHSAIPNGGQVVLYTESGTTQQTVRVPSLVGKTGPDAIQALRSIGLNVLTSGAPDSGNNVYVISQDHPPGTELPKGSVVTLVMEDTTVVGDH